MKNFFECSCMTYLSKDTVITDYLVEASNKESACKRVLEYEREGGERGQIDIIAKETESPLLGIPELDYHIFYLQAD